MAAVNLCLFLGNLTQDPKLTPFPSGKRVANFTIAVNDHRDDEPLYVAIEAWERHADNVMKYCKAGSTVHVQTRAKIKTWTDPERGKRQRTVYIVDDIQFIGLVGRGQRPAEESAPEGL